MTTLTRRVRRDIGADERKCWMRFNDGLLIDPRRCPAGILAKSHWSFDAKQVPAGEPNAVCACPPAPRSIP